MLVSTVSDGLGQKCPEGKKEGQTLVGFMTKQGVHLTEKGGPDPTTPRDPLPEYWVEDSIIDWSCLS